MKKTSKKADCSASNEAAVLFDNHISVDLHRITEGEVIAGGGVIKIGFF